MAAHWLLFSRMFVILVFSVSMFAKLSDMRSFTRTVRAFFPFSRVVVWGLAGATLLAESTIAVLAALAGEFLRYSLGLSTGLLVAFSVLLVTALARGMSMSCNCFGRNTEQITGYDLVRNIGMLAVVLPPFVHLMRHPLPVTSADWSEGALFLIVSGVVLTLLLHVKDAVVILFPRSTLKAGRENGEI